MDIQKAIDYFLTAKAADGLSERTTEDYAVKLYGFVRESGVEQVADITTQAVRQYTADLLLRKKMGDLSSATVAAQVRPLKVFCRFLANEEPPLLAIDPFRRGAGVKVPPVEGKLHDTIPDADFKKMLAACDLATHEGRRNHAMLCFLYDTGVRVGELCNLKHDALDLPGRAAVVYGKGRRQRTVFFSGPTAKSLSRYIVRMPHRYRADWLWTSLRRNVGGRITENGVGQMLRRVKKDSGVGCRVNPHTFRHTFATNYLRAGGDLNSLMRLMGHADLSILQTYLNLVTEDLRDKHTQFSPMMRVMQRR